MRYGLIDLDELEKEKAKWQKRADAQPDNDKGQWQLFDIRIGQIEEIQKMISSLPSAEQVWNGSREQDETKGSRSLTDRDGTMVSHNPKSPSLTDFIENFKEKK